MTFLLHTRRILLVVCALFVLTLIGLSASWGGLGLFSVEGFGVNEPEHALMFAALSGTYNIPGDYATLDAAITDLNAKGVGGAVTLNLVASHPQTAPAGGYLIGGTGSMVLTTTSATNTVTIQGNGNTITASNALAAGALNDAIFKLIGADYITITGFTMLENPANTTTASATNNMTEWGVALLYVTATDGAQNDTIHGNTIDLNRTYQNTFGIYANATHTATAVTTSATAIGAAGGNSGLKIYANNITDVNNGIVVVGPTAAADNNDPIEIGGSPANANTITNFGTTGTFSGYANVSGTVNGILVRNSRNFIVSNNTVTSSAGGTTTGTLNGIQVPAFSNEPTGTFTNSINNNVLSLQSGNASGAINGINVVGTSASVTSTININANNFQNFGHTAATPSGAITFITQAGTHLNQSISNNMFTNMTVQTTGSVTFISNGNALPAASGVKNVNNNSIVTGFNKAGAGGTITFFTDNGSDPAGAANNCNNNNFSGVTVVGATAITGISDTNGGSPNKTVSGNTISNITGGTSPITAYNINFDNATTIVNNNTASNITNGAAINGMTFGSTGAGTTTASQNNINGLSSTTSTVVGINLSSGTGTTTLSRNKIYNLESTGASGSVNGIFIGSVGNVVNVQNDLIGDLRTPNAAGEALRGINVNSATPSTTLNLSFNTVYLNSAAAGANFASTGIFHTTSAAATTATLNLRDNIIVNTSAFTGTGYTVAYRRSNSTLANYGSLSNYNLFYAGPPSGTNLIYSDGTNNFPSLALYKAFVASRDSASISENPPFISTSGSNASFLHISTSTPTQTESGGVPVSGITDDFDGDTRNTSFPDIGGDEFTGIAVDMTAPNIGYTPFNDTTLTTNRTLTATITDASGVAGGANSPRIYFRKDGGAYVSTQCSGVFTCTIDNSLIGGVSNRDTIGYFVIGQDAAGNVGSNPATGLIATSVNNIVSPPTTPNTYKVQLPFPSSINVGTTEVYSSLTNNDPGGLFNAINSGVLTSDVTVNITSDLTSETGAVGLNEWVEEGAGGYKITIKPAAGARIVSGSSTDSIIRLNGADRVTIDGSLTAGTAVGVGGDASLRNLTVQNTNTSATGGAVVAIEQGPNSANNVTIKNVVITGQDPTQTFIGLHIGGNIIGTSPTGSSNNNVIVDNCAFKRSLIAIFDDGVSAAAPATGNLISHNDITAAGPDRMRRAGIFFFNQNGMQVTDNAIGGITDDEAADAIGIAAGIQNVTTTATTSGGVFNSTIARNRISGITSTSATGPSAVGIAIAGDPAGQNFVVNNMITGVTAPSISPDIAAGIFVAGVPGSNTHVLYNSIANTGDRGSVASQIGSYGIAISGSNPVVELKDNILYNSQTSGGGANAKSYAIGAASTTFTNMTSNFNDFFSSGANAAGFRTGSLDSAGTDIANLAAWKAATGGDANSLAVDPMFIDPTANLHLPLASPMINIGTPLGSVTNDIDGNIRSGPTDIGADEVSPGSIQFSAISYTVSEAGPNAVLTVTRTGGADFAASVDYSLSGGTATGGAACGGSVDYINTGGTIIFANGDSTNKTINVPICNDAVFEGGETFNTTLSNPTGGVAIGTPNPASVTINDDDPVPTVQFSSTTYFTQEGLAQQSPDGGLGAVITVTLSGPAQSNVTVHYATSDGSASGGAACTSGIDYINTSGTLTFLSTETTKTFFVPTCADTIFEGDETVNLTLSNPSVAVLRTPTAATLTIIDNDPPGGPVVVMATAGTTGPTNYATVKAAIDAINAGTHQGIVSVGVVVSTVETNAPIVLNGSGAGPASYSSVVIRALANGVTVSGATPTGRGLIELNGADNVTIDGDNPNSAGINRDLTIENTSANSVAFTSVVRLALAASVITSTDNVTIKNLNIVGNSTGRNISSATDTSGTENTTFGIFAGPGASTVSTTTPPSAVSSVSASIGAPATANNLVISNNNITTVARGISVNGSATTVFPGLSISGDRIGNPVTGAVDQVTAIGITAQGSANGVISGNTIWIEGYLPSSAATHGINVGANSAVGTFTIDSNVINRARNNNPQTWSAFGIDLEGGNNHVVRNNFVSGVINDQTAGTGAFGSTFGAFGIRVGNGTGHHIYHNSVNLYGAIPGTTDTNSTAAFLLVSTSQTGVDVRNNVFSNQISGGNPSGTRNASVFLPSAGSSAINLTWNNNAYFVGTDLLDRLAQIGTTFGTGEYLPGNFDPTSTTNGTNLRAYTSTLSSTGTNDNASFATTAPPPFVSSSDLHVPAGTHARLESGGASVGVTVDIDSTPRNLTTPDIGADEFAGLPPFTNDMLTASFVTPTNGATLQVGQSFSPQAIYSNNGTASQSNVTVRYRIIDSGMTTVYDQATTIPSIAPLQSTAAIFPVASLSSLGTFMIQASVELAGDQDTSNDRISGTITEGPPPGSISVNDVRVVEGNSGTANAVFSVTYAGTVSPGSVHYATANGTAIAGPDYTSTSGTLNFTTAQTLTVTVPIIGDVNKEENEIFFLNLSNPVNATIARGQGVGIIIDDDRSYISDFDHDHAADLSVFRPSEGQWYVFQSSNGTPKQVNFGLNGDVPVPGDYDGDGSTDFAVFRAGTWYILSSANGSVKIVNWGLAGDKPVQGDYDGDGKADIAVFRPSDGTWWVLKSSDGTNYSVPFGISTDRPVQGDFDGDFKTDIAVYRDGIWYVLRSSDGQVAISSFGIASDKPVVGDFDGDGKDDIAIFRDGDWWILRSLTGTASAIHWGLAGDIPVPADYDGDGTTDIAVFRPLEGNWYILKSSDQTAIIAHFGTNGDIPIPSAYLAQ